MRAEWFTAMKSEWTLAAIASGLAALGQAGLAAHGLSDPKILLGILAIPGYNLAFKLGLEVVSGQSDLAPYVEIVTNFLFYFSIFSVCLIVKRRLSTTKRKYGATL